MTMLAYFTENRSVGVQNRKSMTSLRLVADTPITVILNHNFLSASNAPFVTGNKQISVQIQQVTDVSRLRMTP